MIDYRSEEKKEKRIHKNPLIQNQVRMHHHVNSGTHFTDKTVFLYIKNRVNPCDPYLKNKRVFISKHPHLNP